MNLILLLWNFNYCFKYVSFSFSFLKQALILARLLGKRIDLGSIKVSTGTIYCFEVIITIPLFLLADNYIHWVLNVMRVNILQILRECPINIFLLNGMTDCEKRILITTTFNIDYFIEIY